MTAWTAIADGDDVEVSPGDSIAVVASVKAKHSLADLGSFAAARGITLQDLAQEGERAGLGPDPRAPDYRYVAAVGLASQKVSLPWSVPWPLSMIDSSQLVSAWTAPPGARPPAPAPPEPSAPSGPAWPSMTPLLWVGAVALALAYNARETIRRRPILARARR